MPAAGNASSYGGGDFTSTISAALDENGEPVGGQVALAGSPDGGRSAALDQDRINLMQWTLEQQKIDAANRQIEALKGAVIGLQKVVSDMQSAQKAAEDAKKAATPAAKDAAPAAKDAAPAKDGTK